MLNYRQLHYFWVVAKTGSIVRACEQLNLTPQTISGQISLLEQTFGIALFQRVGRQLELTEAGRQALPYAEQMFQTGNELEAMLRAQPDEQQIPFRVGVADVVPKSIVYRLIAPTMELSEPIRITCREDKLERLLADLAIQRLDLVISDSPMPTHLDIKGYSQKLGECGISFFATQALADQHGGDFPQCLQGAPLLIPGAETVVRSRLQRWFAEQQIQPRIIGEFDVDGIVEAAPGCLWAETHAHAGISRDFFDAYFDGRSRGFAIRVGEVRRYDTPLLPQDVIDNFTPPQSYMYVNDRLGRPQADSRQLALLD